MTTGIGQTSHPVPPPGPSPLARLRTYFLTGLIIAGPIGITVWLAVQVINFVDSLVMLLLPAQYQPAAYLPFSVPGIGILVLLVLLTLVGFLAANFAGRTLLRLGERIVGRMPVVRSIYGALKQIFETVLAQSSTSFREVVLVEYPRRGLWALGFVTSSTRGEVQNLLAGDVVNVFVPTTPNPTSGFLLFVPRSDLVTLAMPVEDGIKMVISGGLITPPEIRAPAVEAATGPSRAGT